MQLSGTSIGERRAHALVVFWECRQDAGGLQKLPPLICHQTRFGVLGIGPNQCCFLSTSAQTGMRRLFCRILSPSRGRTRSIRPRLVSFPQGQFRRVLFGPCLIGLCNFRRRSTKIYDLQCTPPAPEPACQSAPLIRVEAQASGHNPLLLSGKGVGQALADHLKRIQTRFPIADQTANGIQNQIEGVRGVHVFVAV